MSCSSGYFKCHLARAARSEPVERQMQSGVQECAEDRRQTGLTLFKFCVLVKLFLFPNKQEGDAHGAVHFQ